MTPDTIRIDLVFKGVGRINRASGTTVPAVVSKLKRMLRALYEDGRLDVLRAIRDGHVTFLQVYDAYRRRALHELPIGDTMPMLAETMRRWIESATPDYSKKHLNNLRTSLRRFEKHDPAARVADLPRVLEDLRVSFGATHPRSFNLDRSSALAFVRATLKRSHPIYIRCAAVEMRKVPKAPLRQSLTPANVAEWFPHPETDPIDAIAWSMVTTGMHQEEYWGRWDTRADRVHINGTKRGGRVRDVPLVRVPAVPRISRDWFEKSFRKRFDSVITPYDLRRTYSRWLELAGVPRTRRRLYMGHGVKDVTDLYERAEVTAFLAEDAKRVRVFLGLPDAASKPVEALG
jgi:integrase